MDCVGVLGLLRARERSTGAGDQLVRPGDGLARMGDRLVVWGEEEREMLGVGQVGWGVEMAVSTYKLSSL